MEGWYLSLYCENYMVFFHVILELHGKIPCNSGTTWKNTIQFRNYMKIYHVMLELHDSIVI